MKRWLHVAFSLLVSVLTLTLSAAPCSGAELAWSSTNLAASAHAKGTAEEPVPTLGTDDATDTHRAIVPDRVHVESASASRPRARTMASSPAVFPLHVIPPTSFRFSPTLTRVFCTNVRSLSAARARAFLMVFLN